MNHYTIELLSTKDNVFFSTVVLSDNIQSALEIAKEKAYHQMDKHDIVIRFISVKDDNEHYVYNMLTKTSEKWY